ncbi:ion transporter [Schaalia odontolytica]|uniref:Ion transporter n=1 Tax=Schaalia odontolytica TaxID=1660 RepID=A0A857A4R2_9ACTO|nr:ion transporter [Schaalia odontolytica]QGS10001.1 ion transporter [Schaalia odontolytica]
MRKRLYSLLDGDGGAAMWCGRVMTVLIIASLLPLCFKESSPVLETIEYACVLVFIADYLARWATADLKLGKGALSFLIYPFTPMAVIDLLSILPVFNALNDALRTLRVLRLFRALRTFKLIRYSKSASVIAAVFEKEREALLAVLGLAIGYILVSALAIFNVEPETFNTFFDAVYWAVVSLTTVGYGDLYPTSDVGRAIAMISSLMAMARPTSDVGRAIAMISSLMGVAVVALPSGIITAGMLDELRGGGGEGN